MYRVQHGGRLTRKAGLMINPALKKRFNLLCPPEQRGDFGWWAYRVIYFAPYRVCGLPPKIKDKDARKAMYAYARDLVQHYAPAKKLSCGHRSRGSYCCTCANRNAAAAQLSIDAWLLRKGITKEQWRDKVENRSEA